MFSFFCAVSNVSDHTIAMTILAWNNGWIHLCESIHFLMGALGCIFQPDIVISTYVKDERRTVTRADDVDEPISVDHSKYERPQHNTQSAREMTWITGCFYLCMSYLLYQLYCHSPSLPHVYTKIVSESLMVFYTGCIVNDLKRLITASPLFSFPLLIVHFCFLVLHFVTNILVLITAMSNH
jgi:hypothetical protein